MAFDLGTPVNTALLLYILYSVQRILFPSNSPPKSVPHEFKGGYSWMPKAHPPTLLFKTYTPKTLEPHNGEEGKRILLAINGVVYDVTAGRNFYGPRASSLGVPRPQSTHLSFLQRACTLTSLGEMLREGWRSSRLTWVCACCLEKPCRSFIWMLLDMLTPIDKPLDKLDDLTAEEMCVPSMSLCSCSLTAHNHVATTCEVRLLFLIILPHLTHAAGWMDHFSNKYIVCGKLVENDAV